MGVRCADDIGTGSEQWMVNIVTGGVDGAGGVAVGIFHFSAGSDQDQLVDRGPAEGDTPVEQPEVVGQHRSRADMWPSPSIPQRNAPKMRYPSAHIRLRCIRSSATERTVP